MTLILTEGFETYAVSGDISLGTAKKWTSSSMDLRSDFTPRTGAKFARSPALTKTVAGGSEHATFVAGASFVAGDNVSTELIGFYADANTTQHGNLIRNVGGTLSLRVGTTVVATSAGTLIESNWHYFELVSLLSDTVGTLNLYVDSNPTPTLTFSGDTKNGGTATVFDTFRVSGGSSQNVDDIYLLTGAGAAPLNARIGEVRCYPLAPNGNGTTNQGLGSDGNSVDNYLLVDEAASSLNTADYVGITTDGEKDLYNYGALTPITGTVLNVEVAGYVKKSDSGAKSVRYRVRTGGLEFTGADGALASATFAPHREQFFVNPNTTVPWTIAEVNAMEAGFEARP